MAQFSGTYDKYDAAGLREQLSDIIYNISPTDTPFMSSAGRMKAKQTLVEWQTDSLAAAISTNQRIEGDEASFTAPSATSRVGNYTQISTKTLILSGTLEAIDKAGRKSELSYQMSKRSAEIKRDMETMFLENIATVAGDSSTARKAAGLPAHLYSNDSVGSGGGLDAWSGTPSAARTAGTQRAFTETILKAVIELVWSSGGQAKVLMLGPVNRQKVSATFSGIATRNFDLSNVSPKATAIIASADVYVSDFGVLRVIPNRFQRERDGWVLDFTYINVAFLRPFQVSRLAKTGDAEKRLLLAEYTLQIQQEAALGMAADLTVTA